MTIERFTFSPSFLVTDTASLNLEDALLFAKRKEVPPNMKIDITPTGYSSRYSLRTFANEVDGQEDTVGEIEILNIKLGTKNRHRIDEQKPLVILARPNVLDGGTGIRVDEVVRYVPSSGLQQVLIEEREEPIPVEIYSFQEAEPIEVEVRPWTTAAEV